MDACWTRPLGTRDPAIGLGFLSPHPSFKYMTAHVGAGPHPSCSGVTLASR